MARRVRSVALRYALALGAYALVILLPIGLQRLFKISFDVTPLVIAVMIASAWYLGTGPGLVVAFAFELTLDYFAAKAGADPFTAKAAANAFNRLVLFMSLVLFAGSRRGAERRLREQREWLRVTLTSIGDAVIATDLDGSVNFINPTAEALTGWTTAEAIDKPLGEVFRIVNEETRAPVESPLSIIAREGIVVGLANHTTLLARDGREIPIEDSGAPIKDSYGKVIGAIVVFHDVSERRRAARERDEMLKREQEARVAAESADRIKDEFLATVSHELRTPLTAILGWAAMLNLGPLEEETARGALEVIERNARSQAQIIDDILDVSRIINGKLRIDSRPVVLASVVQAAVETLRPAAAAKGITLTAALAQTDRLVIGDPDRLQQIIWNLVSNAIKFTPQGGRVEVRLEGAGSHLEVRVSDSGVGIDERFLPHVFERFRQADSSTTRAHGGLGLGLAIARHLAELHGGTVSAESDGVGRGASFVVRLPQANGRDEATRPPAAGESRADSAPPAAARAGGAGDSPAGEPDLTGVRVLVVEDEPDTLEILRVALGQYGAQVRTASSSACALEAFSEWQPDVLVSDLGMPGEDGFTLIREVRSLAPERGGAVPAAALTAYVREEDRLRTLEAGYQAHVPKPIEPTALASVVAGLARRAPRA